MSAVTALFSAHAAALAQQALPKGWSVETKTVKAATPTGDQEKQIAYYTNTIGMKLVNIPAGEFMMGSPDTEESHEGNEAPQHKVRITRAFFMGAYEVTQAEYEKVVGDNPAHYPNAGNPVEEVPWAEAAQFCKRLSAREGVEYHLPTEAQWEYACRAGTTTPFYTGDTISTDQANYNGNFAYGDGKKGRYREKPTPVGSFAPNPFGLYDMHGNLWEWCQDWYGKSYYSQSPIEDPQGPSSGLVRVLRGGCWLYAVRQMRSANRHWYVPTHWSSNIGFRVVGELR